MKKTSAILFLLALILLPANLSAQTRGFNLGKWIEIHHSVLKELNESYVDTLPIDRIMRTSIDAMMASLDPYTVYVPEEENENFEMMLSGVYGGIGAVIHKKTNEYLMINEPYFGCPCVDAGLRCGDEVLEIDGISTLPLTSKECSDRLRGRPGTTVVLKVKKAYTGEIKEVQIVRQRIHLPDMEYAGMINDTTGYILLTGFTDGAGQAVREKVIELKGKGSRQIVLDLRGNGGGLLREAVEVVSIFVPKGSLVCTANGLSYDTPKEYRTTSSPVDCEIPLIVMVDSGSASSSEIVAGAIQDLDRGTIMGRRTYGKGLVQSVRPVAYGGQVKVTIAKYYTPSGRCVQAIDYSKRNEDGSVGHIPDSLTSEFRTAGGRIVRDGGGIAPDVDIKGKRYGRVVYSLFINGIIDAYALKYVSEHPKIAPLKDFSFSQEDFEDFINFAKTQKFDYRSGAKALFDQMKEELESDGIAEMMTAQIKALEEAINMEKENVIRFKKEEIIPFIEEEIAVRYYFQEAGIEVRLRYDQQLKTALESPQIAR